MGFYSIDFSFVQKWFFFSFFEIDRGRRRCWITDLRWRHTYGLTEVGWRGWVKCVGPSSVHGGGLSLPSLVFAARSLSLRRNGDDGIGVLQGEATKICCCVG
ncbi:hypothetical protein L484_008318 [Morus notabilis]|uniref:Uncharacterized protein n=1 Tax=Morus notabilis TaxID=981085 RepID=W9RAZ1_9ROSA|nr:hypothetical protein L484_008316 [Morus notabilis]EXB62515.1 hypothetical protein L484_008318 [Morus notabilis]